MQTCDDDDETADKMGDMRDDDDVCVYLSVGLSLCRSFRPLAHPSDGP